MAFSATLRGKHATMLNSLPGTAEPHHKIALDYPKRCMPRTINYNKFFRACRDSIIVTFTISVGVIQSLSP